MAKDRDKSWSAAGKRQRQMEKEHARDEAAKTAARHRISRKYGRAELWSGSGKYLTSHKKSWW